MAKNSYNKRTQSAPMSTASHPSESRKDVRVSPTSKRILEEITVRRRDVMKELANR